MKDAIYRITPAEICAISEADVMLITFTKMNGDKTVHLSAEQPGVSVALSPDVSCRATYKHVLRNALGVPYLGSANTITCRRCVEIMLPPDIERRIRNADDALLDVRYPRRQEIAATIGRLALDDIDALHFLEDLVNAPGTPSYRHRDAVKTMETVVNQVPGGCL